MTKTFRAFYEELTNWNSRAHYIGARMQLRLQLAGSEHLVQWTHNNVRIPECQDHVARAIITRIAQVATVNVRSFAAFGAFDRDVLSDRVVYVNHLYAKEALAPWLVTGTSSFELEPTPFTLTITYDQSSFKAVDAAVMAAVEECCSLPAYVELESCGDFVRPYQITGLTFQVAEGGSMLWQALEPFVGGIVKCFPTDKRASDGGDQLSALLLDRRLVRARGLFMSSHMAGAVLPFLPVDA